VATSPGTLNDAFRGQVHGKGCAVATDRVVAVAAQLITGSVTDSSE
jgi:hypothetical protein